jgi:hypothetical protein
MEQAAAGPLRTPVLSHQEEIVPVHVEIPVEVSPQVAGSQHGDHEEETVAVSCGGNIGALWQSPHSRRF